jgi:hypothetical protein
LFIKSFIHLSAVNMGFRSEEVLTVNLARIKGDADAFYTDVLDRISALPQVRAAGAINFPPLSGSGWSQDVTIEGQPPRPEGDFIWAAHREVSLGYFRAMGIPLIAGRSFVATDRYKRVAIISQTMARRYWPDQEAIGKRFGISCPAAACDWNSVMGVVADVKEVGAAAEPVTAMYFLGSGNHMTLVLRGMKDPTGLIADVRSVVRSVDPDQPIADVRMMEDIISESLAPQRLTMRISGLFAALALLLASVGIYGVMSYSVTERSHEFSIGGRCDYCDLPPSATRHAR